MRKTTLAQRALIMAAGAVLLSAVSPSLLAQYQTENNTGRALDANNRLGSEGYNERGQSAGGYNADDVVYGNVTRGRQFRGNASGDPRAFRGTINSPSSNLVRDTGPSPIQQGGTYNPGGAQRWWGDEKGVNAPTGFQQLTPGSPGAFQVATPDYRTAGDLRLNNAIPTRNFASPIPSGGEFSLRRSGGAADAETDAESADADPLASRVGGVGKLDMAALMPSQQILQRLQLDESRVRQMRQEVQGLAGAEGAQMPVSPDDLTTAPESPINSPLTSQVNSNVQTAAATGSVNTAQALRQQLLSPEAMAARTSEQYAQLEDRLNRFKQRQGMSDEQANRQFMQDWNKAQEAQKQKNAAAEQQKLQQSMQQQQRTQEPDNKAPETAARPREWNRGGTPTGDRARVVDQMRESASDPSLGVLPPQPDIPLRIVSLADGVKATGLKQLLTNAEKAMQVGKFTQALDYYDTANTVSPGNPMVLMGRSIAELGAGYYARAQVHLEQVLTAHPAMMMARYDLKSFYGEDRLQYLVRDLKDVAQSEQRQARPMFLLAFIAYSTENKQRTADYLNLAEQRGGNKEFYAKLREYWSLNENPTPAQPGVEAPAKDDGNK